MSTNDNCWAYRDIDLVPNNFFTDGEVALEPVMGAAQGLLTDSDGTFSAWSELMVPDPRTNPPLGAQLGLVELRRCTASPVESNVSPASGTATGGEAITVNGRNMLEVTQVDFGAEGRVAHWC